MEKLEMNRRLVELLEVHVNGRPLMLDEYNEILWLIAWHLIHDKLFAENMLRACL
mgnify:CR=1 FL=1